ncbi:Response to aba and salt 1 [Dorcoceras hygrometricum]|uniref:Response to aba and salt 1 n=1 Tax=Dorcoceras hygrometricum TaxID=472368 RepID=A0A2Z7D0T3_9LAMI|nr:Response to aba and salt 1 [Dorcoceras hygrometricum]
MPSWSDLVPTKVGLMCMHRRATRNCQCGTGRCCSSGVATRGGASAELGSCVEQVGLMCLRRRATRGGASAELDFRSPSCAELVGLMLPVRNWAFECRAGRLMLPVRNWALECRAGRAYVASAELGFCTYVEELREVASAELDFVGIIDPLAERDKSPSRIR